MPSIFPSLFAFSYVSPFILRLCLAFVLLSFSYYEAGQDTPWNKIISYIKIVASVLIAAGLLFQPALILIILSFLIEKFFLKKIYKTHFLRNKIVDILIVVMALTLLLSGPGILAIDMPL